MKTGTHLLSDLQRVIKAYELLSTMPSGIVCDVKPSEISLQANTQEQVGKIRSYFPGCVWEKRWDNDLNWWEYLTKWEGFQVQIYAVREAPATCKAIYETKVTTKRIPVRYREEIVEEEVLVGWDCSGESGGEK